MNLSRINLNLLRALDALLIEKNVTKAGQKIFITQSAMSSNLNQLREIFYDDLLVRGPGGMTPTSLAEELTPKVKEILNQIDNLLSSRQEFDYSKSDRVFNIGISEYIEFSILPYLYEYLLEFAPNIKLNLVRISQMHKKASFEINMTELGIGVLLSNPSPQLSSELLFDEPYVCVARKDHPLMKTKLTTSDYLHAKHIIGTFIGHHILKTIEKVITKLKLEPQKIVTISHAFPTFCLLEKTNFVTIVPQRIAEQLAKRFNLTFQDLPFKVPKVEIFQAWPRYLDNDSGLCWLRNVIKQIP